MKKNTSTKLILNRLQENHEQDYDYVFIMVSVACFDYGHLLPGLNEYENMKRWKYMKLKPTAYKYTFKCVELI